MAPLAHWMLAPLYAILDVEAVSARGLAPVDVCVAWLSAGVRLIQLRAKHQGTGAFLELAAEVQALCHAAGAVLIINDRADVAAMAGAAGVHVGQEDLSPADVRRVVGPTATVGLSTHNQAQVVAGASAPVSYLAIGPIFATRTKLTGYEALGLQALGDAASVARGAGLPLAAIGGITLNRAPAVRAAGADAVAVISDLLPESDLREVESRARTWVRHLV